jgi:hypothetical protein
MISIHPDLEKQENIEIMKINFVKYMPDINVDCINNSNAKENIEFIYLI